MRYVVGLDLGQINDATALVVLERQATARVWAGRHLQRFPLGTRYPDIVETVRQMLSRPPLQRDCHLVFDETGVGRPVGDLLRSLRIGCRVTGVTIHGGDSVTSDVSTSSLRVPKRDLVSSVQLLIQQRRLKFAETLLGAELLRQELASFRVHISLETGHDSYGAGRSGENDDLVLAVGLACWVGERFWPLPAGPPNACAKVPQEIFDMFDIPAHGSPNPDLFAVADYAANTLERTARGWKVTTSGLRRRT